MRASSLRRRSGCSQTTRSIDPSGTLLRDPTRYATGQADELPTRRTLDDSNTRSALQCERDLAMLARTIACVDLRAQHDRFGTATFGANRPTMQHAWNEKADPEHDQRRAGDTEP